MSLIVNFSSGPITIKRSSGSGTFVEGKYVPGLVTEIETFASIQPLTGKEIELLPHGRREKKSIKIYIDQELFVNDQISALQADVIVFKGVEYEVFTVMEWANFTDLPHYECIAQMVDAQGNA